MASTLSLVSRNALEHVCERCKVKIADLASESINGGEPRGLPGKATKKSFVKPIKAQFLWIGHAI